MRCTSTLLAPRRCGLERGAHLPCEGARSSAAGAGRVVVVSMRVMSAGRGNEYLLKSIAAGDGGRDLGTSLARYYVHEGSPRGTIYL
jgi:hypothetical protein